MTLNRIARWVATGLAAGAAWLAFSAPAEAIPLFARQTGQYCAACHISFPELTAYGREFKLNGYTFGEGQPFPAAVAFMAEYGGIANNTDHNPASSGVVCPSCDKTELVQWSIFFGGKLAENLGMFGQYTFSGAPFDNTSDAWQGAEDNTEVRYVHRFSSGWGGTLEPDTVVGIDVNNNATMQDVWNAVPQWKFPWFPYGAGTHPQVGFGPAAVTYLDGADVQGTTGPQRSFGLGVYGWWHKTVYAELTFYHSPWGMMSWFVNGSNASTGVTGAPNDAASDIIDSWAPYYRLAYSKDWGYSSAEVGLFGTYAKTFFCNPTSGTICNAAGNSVTDKYHDFGIDYQYQYNRGEPWVFATSGSWIHENKDLTPFVNATTYGLPAPLASNPSDTVNEYNIRATAYYDRKYGATLGWSMYSGSNDPILYGQGINCGGTNGASGGSCSGSPTSQWWTLELNYLPLQNMRFSAAYFYYTKLNGGNDNFDGYGNNAGGQNMFYAAIWWAF
ncbi:MAG TPA: hypothetical protein VEI05_02985 [Burkholderiaceae bacterium]|nr:hypothetical protein [Burkholderiaceae bacterium]